MRGDIRISGHYIDGNSNTLAYNYYPDTGDMVIDTGDNYFNSTFSDSIRLFNVLQHEHGHGLALPHVCPMNETKLMEPTADQGTARLIASGVTIGGQSIGNLEASLKADLPQVLGVLEVPDVGLKVPVYATNTDLVMDRGAGVIDGMSYPHEPGNIGISGHRDGYFRVLKDVKLGDKLVLQTLEGPKQFTISNY